MPIDHKKTMSEFIDDVTATSGCPKNVVEKIVPAIFACIAESVMLDEQVRILKFGSFSPVDKPERKIRNLRTGQLMTLPACRSTKFKPSDLLIASLQDPQNPIS